ncbi:helix-turn-helix domain-containing protein [Bacillus pseudomycoides]|uniref:helix-turn-helix domain-containing protein n=1 Tax=Bacillus TaxID=1386 RepID=UPI000BFE6382|nr:MULTISPECIES: XRE family transcriptional regulator [Bacillus]MCX2825295.1 helix-turn-helix domain-containing protein [Bacillus sp. DHT2]MDR4919145.1 helix-turn-helix domain-containing protein [Bacillus pseudomycoides]PHB31771.1 transcriptional regulator [Bacillus pseudomycoides]
MLGKKISELRKQQKLSQYELAERLGFSRGKLANYEQGQREPDYDTLKKIADFFEVSTDYLLGRTEKKELFSNPIPNLSEKEKRDIAKDLEKTLEQLENSDEALMFDGEPIDEHTKEMIRISLENSMRMAKQLAKQKFTPNKYKQD